MVNEVKEEAQQLLFFHEELPKNQSELLEANQVRYKKLLEVCVESVFFFLWPLLLLTRFRRNSQKK